MIFKKILISFLVLTVVFFAVEQYRTDSDTSYMSSYSLTDRILFGNNIADIGKTIEDYIKPQGYGIVRDLVGHGVGHSVHEDPKVPNYYDQQLQKWDLHEGVVIAIEPMVTMGDYNVKTAADGWSISTVDKSLSAHFEHTVVITKNGPIVATRRPSEKF